MKRIFINYDSKLARHIVSPNMGNPEYNMIELHGIDAARTLAAEIIALCDKYEGVPITDLSRTVHEFVHEIPAVHVTRSGEVLEPLNIREDRFMYDRVRWETDARRILTALTVGAQQYETLKAAGLPVEELQGLIDNGYVNAYHNWTRFAITSGGIAMLHEWDMWEAQQALSQPDPSLSVHHLITSDPPPAIQLPPFQTPKILNTFKWAQAHLPAFDYAGTTWDLGDLRTLRVLYLTPQSTMPDLEKVGCNDLAVGYLVERGFAERLPAAGSEQRRYDLTKAGIDFMTAWNLAIEIAMQKAGAL